ncbi:MAG: DUF1571 domain-containing protein [Gemmataceae bacterium]
MHRILLLLPVCALLGCGDDRPSRLAAEEPAVVVDAPALPIDPTRGPRLDASAMEQLARTDPIAFLERALERYDHEVAGYRAVLVKQERIAGRLGLVEHVAVCFRERPFSVRMEWKKGTGLAARLAFVRGENDDQLLVKPAGWRGLVGVVARDPHGDEAKLSSRYPITEFGIRAGSVNTLAAWKAARARGRFEYVFGGPNPVAELGGRRCWEIRRINYERPEVDGITEATLLFDTETWLQTGSVLTGAKGERIATYHFRDLEVNPAFAPETFTRAGLLGRLPAEQARLSGPPAR